jgi:hypothetical protein
MDTARTGSILLAVVAAGLLAGLVVGLFHYIATEPVIERAIAVEESAHPAGEHETPVVSRDVQRVGLIVGWVLYGLLWGLIFGLVYALIRPRFGGVGVAPGALLSALAAYWLVGLFPFLKYPANPPGVGEPETIAQRQVLFVLFWVLSVGGVLLAGWVYRLLRPRLAGATPWLAALGSYAVYALALYALMPPNPDPVTLPTELVAAFRALSLVGLTLFWLVLGAAFGLLVRGLSRAPARQPG